jgi:23S rRNA (cytosine1962-C5)-methyltransferase
MNKNTENRYQLLDCGGGKKLEKLGKYTVVRPAPQAIWQPFDALLWTGIDSEFDRLTGEKGLWRARNIPEGIKRRIMGTGVDESWEIENDRGTRFLVEPNQFGNIGVFTEHWTYTDTLLEIFDPKKPVLNLFSYTGSSSTDLAKRGYKIVAVDSSKSSLEGYTKNMSLNHVERAGHKLVLEDCEKYVAREIRRGSQYSSIIMDAPSFGRGTKGEVFNIEDDFLSLVLQVKQLLAPRGAMVLTNHSPRFTPTSLEILMTQVFEGKKVLVQEIVQQAVSGARLPSGYLVVVK